LDKIVKNNISMLILADRRIPEPARKKLEAFGKVLWLEPGEITYGAVSTHPDIFFCPVGDRLIIAPNLSGKIKTKLLENGINYTEGEKPVGKRYPETARYNTVITDNFLIGNTNFTDPKILEAAGNREIIHVKQGYTRCNLIPLGNNRFITSDKGIEKTLLQYGLEVLYVDPAGILLPGFNHGFIGGTCGVWQDKLLFTGSLKHFPEGGKIREFVQDIEVVELYDGPLFDGGSILFIS
jgi:hypothetical protein